MDSRKRKGLSKFQSDFQYVPVQFVYLYKIDNKLNLDRWISNKYLHELPAPAPGPFSRSVGQPLDPSPPQGGPGMLHGLTPTIIATMSYGSKVTLL